MTRLPLLTGSSECGSLFASGGAGKYNEPMIVIALANSCFPNSFLLLTLPVNMGKGLKAALQSQQSRLKAKQKVTQAAQAAELKSRQRGGQAPGAKNGRPTPDVKGKKKATVQPNRPPFIPFRLSDKILLIGEGNFSFARALVEDAPGHLRALPPPSITATAYDSEKECYEKYPEAAEIVTFLKSKGVIVMFSVDGTHLEKHPALKGRRWDRIVWNFPHAGESSHSPGLNILIIGLCRKGNCGPG